MKPESLNAPPGSRIVATGVLAGEGPVWMPDGTLLVCQLAGRGLLRFSAAGERLQEYPTGGTPTGAALGPDGAIYSCNDGDSVWVKRDGTLLPDHEALERRGGRYI